MEKGWRAKLKVMVKVKEIVKKEKKEGNWKDIKKGRLEH